MRRLILILAVMLALHMPALAAQDATPTPEAPPTETVIPSETPIPTETAIPTETPVAPAPVIDDEVNFTLGIGGFLLGLLALLLGGGGIGYVFGHIAASKEHKDNLEKAYESTSPATQEQIRRVYETTQTAWDRVDALVRDVMKFVNEVTDKQPNVESPVVIEQQIKTAVDKAFHEAAQAAQYQNPTV